ncbi:MAG: hypothetical protein KC645_02810 [Gemmatimonadetes bacterium]|nr:hypothetical protein [Gemmatimonadota bacterium]
MSPRTLHTRREALALLAGASGALALAPRVMEAAAEAHGSDRTGRQCPTLRGRRLSWLVGWSPGGGYDLYSRLLERPLERTLEAEVVVENVPGASGIVAARRIARARPDGRTLGILNGGGLLLAPWSNPGFAPDLEADFSVLGRILPHDQTLLVRTDSGFGALADLVTAGRSRALVFGATGPTTINVLLTAVLEDLFGVQVEIVLGYPGSQELLASVERGDLDAAVIGDESAELMRALRPLLRFSAEGSDSGGAPPLLGPDGLLETQPALFPDPDRARADAAALDELMAVGRLVAAPRLPGSLASCLEAAVVSALADPELSAAAGRAGRSVRPASSSTALRHVRAAKVALPRFATRVERAIGRATR